jgi:hypothetical protein
MRLSSYILVTTLLVLSYSVAFGSTIGTVFCAGKSFPTKMPMRSHAPGGLESLATQSSPQVMAVSVTGGDNAKLFSAGTF